MGKAKGVRYRMSSALDEVSGVRGNRSAPDELLQWDLCTKDLDLRRK